MTEVDRMAVIRRWDEIKWTRMESIDGELFVPRVEARVRIETLRNEVDSLDSQLAGAVGERDALRMTLHNVGAWLSSGNFAGWEMVVSEIEATLNHPGGAVMSMDKDMAAAHDQDYRDMDRLRDLRSTLLDFNESPPRRCTPRTEKAIGDVVELLNRDMAQIVQAWN